MQRGSSSRTILFLAACCLLIGPSGVSAQDGTTIAVVDIQRLLQESLAGQSIEAQMQQYRTSFGQEIAAREADLRAREQDLMQQASILAPEVLAEERRQFEEDVIALQQEVRSRQQGIEQGYAEAIATVRQHVLTILQDLVEQRGIDVVLARSGYVVASRDLDLTDDVLGELDRALPTVSLNVSSGG